jgi:hypothetical protein
MGGSEDRRLERPLGHADAHGGQLLTQQLSVLGKGGEMEQLKVEASSLRDSGDPSGRPRARPLASADVKAAPSCHVTPRRRRNR